MRNPLLYGGGNGQLLGAARAMATAATAPAISTLQQEIGQNDAQTQGALKQAGGYFTQLGDLAKQGYQDQGQIASGLNQQLGKIGTDEQAQLQGIGQNALSSLGKYAPQSDAAGSLAAPARSALTAEIARQQGLAAQDQGAFKSFGAQQGANYRNAGAQQLGTDALAGTQALGNIASAGTVRNEPLEAKIANIQGVTYPADVQTALGKLWQSQATDRIAEAGLGIKGQLARASMLRSQADLQNASTNRQKVAVTRQNDLANQALKAYQINSQNSRAANSLAEKTRYDSANIALKQATLNLKAASQGGRIKPLSTHENNAWFSGLGQAEALIRQAQRTPLSAKEAAALGLQPGAILSEQQIRGLLASGKNPGKRAFDPVTIQAAYELLGYGAITQSTAQTMRNMGLNLSAGTYNNQPFTIAPNYVPPTSSSARGAQGRGKFTP